MHTSGRRLQHDSQSRPAAEVGAVWLLCAAAVVAPVLLGASGIWTRLALEATITVAVILWAASGPRSIWATAIPLLVYGLALFQLIPLPDSILVNVAPVSAGAWKVANEGNANAWGQIAVSPGDTLCGIRRLFLAVATVAVVTQVGRSQLYRRRLMASLAASGAIIAALGMVFSGNQGGTMLGIVDLTGPGNDRFNPVIMPVESAGFGRTDWVTVADRRYQRDAANVGGGVGPYIYSNHFAGAVVLTFPVILAWWLAWSHGRLHGLIRWAVALAGMGLMLWMVWALADSRAGVGAAVAASIVLVALTVESRGMRAAAVAVVTAGAAVFVLFLAAGVAMLLGPTDAIVKSLPIGWQAGLTAALNDPRVLAAGIAFRMFLASPILGTGLDSYQLVFARFQRADHTLFYAHNDYAQLLAEAGSAGAVALLIVTLIMLGRLMRFFRDAKGGYRVLNAGPWAALAGLAAHSAFDWNLHLPANAYLACVVGGLCGSSVPQVVGARLQAAAARIPEAVPRFGLIVVGVLCLAMLSRDAISQQAQRNLQKAIVMVQPAATGETARHAGDTVGGAVAFAEKAGRWDRRNSRLALLLGQANLHLATAARSPYEQGLFLDAAAKWFFIARRACAMGRGFPEPIPQKAR
jgi:O-antigen ligase